MRIVDVLIPSAGMDEHSIALTANAILLLLLAPLLLGPAPLLLGLCHVPWLSPLGPVLRVDEANPPSIANLSSDTLLFPKVHSLDYVHINANRMFTDFLRIFAQTTLNIHLSNHFVWS